MRATLSNHDSTPRFLSYAAPRDVASISRRALLPGQRKAVGAASEIIHQAVERYKELCEGKRRGEFVQRQQRQALINHARHVFHHVSDHRFLIK